MVEPRRSASRRGTLTRRHFDPFQLLDYQRELHNHAVQQNMVLRYDYIETGLQHDVVWTAIAFRKHIIAFRFPSPSSSKLSVNNFEYGRGQGSDKKTAREEAARRTIIALIAASYNQL